MSGRRVRRCLGGLAMVLVAVGVIGLLLRHLILAEVAEAAARIESAASPAVADLPGSAAGALVLVDGTASAQQPLVEGGLIAHERWKTQRRGPSSLIASHRPPFLLDAGGSGALVRGEYRLADAQGRTVSGEWTRTLRPGQRVAVLGTVTPGGDRPALEATAVYLGDAATVRASRGEFASMLLLMGRLSLVLLGVAIPVIVWMKLKPAGPE